MNRLEQQLQRRHGLELVRRRQGAARRRKGRRPLPKLQVELLEDRRLLSTLDITNNVLTYTADAGSASNLTIGIDSANTSDVSVQDPGHTVTLTGDTSQWSLGTDGEANGPISSFTSIVVNGLTSSGENLTIGYSHGDPLPATGLSFNPTAATGQATNNLSLSTRNGTFVVFSSETYAPTGAGAGTITYSDSTNSNVPVSFTNLSPVNDTMPATTFIFTGARHGDRGEREHRPRARRADRSDQRHDSIRYNTGCNTIHGTSGSPIVDLAPATRSSASTTPATTTARCARSTTRARSTPTAHTTATKGQSYGQETYWFTTCLNSAQRPRPDDQRLPAHQAGRQPATRSP